MQPNVEERDLELADELDAGLEVLRGDHLVEERARKALAGFHVTAHRADDVPLPDEVLHELAGELDRVPFDPVESRHAELVHLREQLMKAVPELVKERAHLAMREERGFGGGPPGDRIR